MTLTGLRSFRSKLLLMIVLCCAITALLVGTTLILRNYWLTRAMAYDSLVTQADVIGIHSLAALDFEDPEAGKETLQALRADPEIVGAVLFSVNGEEFARYERTPGTAQNLRFGSPGQVAEGDAMVLSEPIIRDGNREGMLVIAYDMSAINRRFLANALVSATMGLLAVGVSLILGLRLLRMLARPVAQLAHVARRVSDTKDYSIRAAKYSDDEFGEFTDVFNTMLERVQQQAREIQLSHERFRFAQKSANAGAWDWNIVSGEVEWSEEFYALAGLDHAALAPSYDEFLALVHVDDRERIRSEVDDAVKHNRELRIEFRIQHPREGTRWLAEFGRTVYDEQDKPVRMAGIAIDITERKLAEQDRLELLESERAARSEAERASRMKDEFVATLSHELRTPLTAILGWAQMLLKMQPENSEIRQGLEIIERNARVQTRIIEDLLDISRIISGKIRLDVQPVDLAAVIDAALATVRPAAEAREIRLQTVVDPNVGPVRGDPNRLQQVVWNLLSNAIKFTSKGGKVQISLARVNSHLEIVVSDTGQGIKPEFIPYVFERFRQADASTTRKHSGLGLGLAIVKQLVELHGGTVSAHSEGDGQGATFTISLPLAAAHDVEPGPDRQHPRMPKAVPFDGEPISLRGVRVLVIDDELDSRDLVSRILSHRDANVHTAASFDEAIHAIHQNKFDVLISDIGMPGKDGYDLIRHVRTLPFESGGAIPAVALTAFARSEDRTRALLAGFQMHLAKPVEPTELIATVGSVAGLTRPILPAS